MSARKFEELECWKTSRELVNRIYFFAQQGNFRRDFGLRDQIQRAAVSVMTNISEGFASNSDKSFRYFLTISYRSAAEVQSLLYVAIDLGYIFKNNFDELYDKINLTKKLISGLIRHLDNKINA